MVDMKPTVTLYTSATCPYCDELRDFFVEHRIVYSEARVDESVEAAKVVMEVVGDQVVPVTIVQFGQASPISVVGFDPQRLSAVLEVDR